MYIFFKSYLDNSIFIYYNAEFVFYILIWIVNLHGLYLPNELINIFNYS